MTRLGYKMPRKLEKIINIVDVESTCWEPQNTKPDDEEQDIIEVGICTLDITGPNPIVGEKESLLVHPGRSKVNEFCTKLTTITPEMVSLENDALKFSEACEILHVDYDSKNRVWASWGDFDRNLFQKQCTALGVKYPFGPRHINLKCLFSIMYGYDHELAMPDALKAIGGTLTGTHHRGHDDAENIAKIAQHMFRR